MKQKIVKYSVGTNAQNQFRVFDKRNIRRIPSRGIVEKRTQNREQVKFLQLYNTEPFITVSATAEYIAASTKAFSFDGNPAEISSNVNMYAPFSIHSFLKVLCSTTKCLRRSFNVEVKYFHRSTITFTGHTTERKAKSQRINVLLNFRLNSLR